MSCGTAYPDIDRLFSKLLEEGLEASEQDRLNEAMRQDASVRELYRKYMMVDAMLRWDLSPPLMEWTGEQEVAEPSRQGPGGAMPPSSIPPIVIDPAPALHSPVGGFVFSHVAAAVILGIGLLIGLAWRISLPVEGDAGPRSTGIAQDNRGQESAAAVGRITALADCQWNKTGTEKRGEGRGERGETQISKFPNPQIPVFLGDRIIVSSGLMEITYDSGAKVILEGPCTFGIDTKRSGYLAVGKLTAKIVASGQWPVVRKTKQESESLATALFAVRTPTAVVIDLGTEFGVEVEESGTTRSHVFQGKVELRENSQRLTIFSPSANHVIILEANQSARIERGQNSKVVITRELGQPERFVRQISKSTNLSPAPRPTIRYRLTDLGALGGVTSRAYAMNATGQVVGQAATVDDTVHAFLYSDGKMQDLGVFYGDKSTAYGINTAGLIVGKSSRSHLDTRAFLYSSGVMRDLGTLGGSFAIASNINDSGQIVGFAQNAQGVQHAFLYDSDTGMADLGALGGPKAKSCACDINVAGLIVGYSDTFDGREHAFLYHSTIGMKDLGTLGGYSGRAIRVNNAGQTVGHSLVGNKQIHAVLYDANKGITDLKRLCTAGQQGSIVIDMNNLGQVVGGVRMTFRGVTEGNAFYYSDGKMHDLRALLDSATGWRCLMPTAINDSGQIAGYGTAPDGNTRAFLLTPANEERGTRDE